jgi:hypothetical protein
MIISAWNHFCVVKKHLTKLSFLLKNCNDFLNKRFQKLLGVAVFFLGGTRGVGHRDDDEHEHDDAESVGMEEEEEGMERGMVMGSTPEQSAYQSCL